MKPEKTSMKKQLAEQLARIEVMEKEAAHSKSQAKIMEIRIRDTTKDKAVMKAQLAAQEPMVQQL